MKEVFSLSHVEFYDMQLNMTSPLEVNVFALMFLLTGISLAASPMLSTDDGSIVALDLTNERWECEVRSSNAKISKPIDGKYSGGSIRCRPKNSDLFIFMNVMGYRVPKNQVMSVEKLIADFYPKHYERQFQKSMVKAGKKTAYYGMNGQKYMMFATHKSKGAINKLAEIYVDGQWFFSVSLEGSDSVFQSHGKEIGKLYGKWQQSLKLKGKAAAAKP